MELSRKEEGIPSVTSKTTIQDLMTGPHISRGGPKGDRIWDFSKDLPTTGILQNRGNIIPFPKGKRTTPAVKAMMQKGDIQVGKAPKTTPEHLKAKKDRHILMRDADEDILRIKRENKDAIERFKEKFLKKDNVEDVYFDNPEDPRLYKPKDDPDKFYAGGLAPLVGEPSYAADFYDDRTPMEEGGFTQDDFNQFLKEREEGYHEGGKRELEKDWERYKRFKKYGPGSVQEAAQGGRIGLAGGSIVKGGRWFIKNLERALKELAEGTYQKGLGPMEKEAFKWEIKGLIGRIKMGEPIPEDMIKTMRQDKRFKDIVKTRSTDPDLYEMEDVILNYGKKGDDWEGEAWDRGRDVVDSLTGPKEIKRRKQIETLKKFDPKERLPNQSGGPVDQEALIQMYLAEGLSYEEAVQAAQSAANLPWDTLKKAEGGIIRAGFPFGGRALKAIMDAWRSNKTWGVGGPPYKPEKTSFNVKEMTKRTLGEELSLKELKELSGSPARPINSPTFDQFNQEFKNIKARILKEKLRESKIHAEAMIESANQTMKKANKENFMGVLKDTEHSMAENITNQFTREGKKQLEEANEGLKAIDIYMGMLQKKGRKLHAEGGRVSYSGGGRAGLPAITYGTPQMNMQGPQMPMPSPQPAGIPGANLQMNQMDLMQQKCNRTLGCRIKCNRELGECRILSMEDNLECLLNLVASTKVEEPL